MKYYSTCFLFICVFSSVFLSGQASLEELDSLYTMSLSQGNYEKALEYVSLSAALALKNNGEDTLYAIEIIKEGELLEYLGKTKEAEALYLKAKDIICKTVGKSTVLYAEAISYLGANYLKTGRYEQSEQYMLEALPILAEKLGKTHEYYAAGLNNLSGLYARIERHEDAIALSKEALEIVLQTGKENSVYHAVVINRLAGFYLSAQQYQSAEALWLDYMRIVKALYGDEHLYIAQGVNNLSLLYQETKDYTKALQCMSEAQAIYLKKFGDKHPEYATVLHNLAQLYRLLGKAEAAEKCYKECLKISQLRHEDLSQAKYLMGFTDLYIDKKEFEKAKETINEARTLIEKLMGRNNSLYALATNNFVEIHFSLKEYDAALEYAMQAIGFNCTDSGKVFTIDKLEVLYDHEFMSYPILLNSLKLCLNTLEAIYKDGGTANSLENAQKVAAIALAFGEKVRHSFLNEEDKLRFLEDLSFLSRKGVELSFLQYQKTEEKMPQITQALRFSEYSKSILLADALKAQRARAFGNIPDSIALEEQAMEKELSDLKKHLLESKDKEEKQAINTAITNVVETIGALRKDIKQKYPKYYQNKYESTPIDVQGIQKLLPDKAALIAYMLGEEETFALYIDFKKTVLISIPVSKTAISDKVKSFRKSLSDYEFIQRENKEATDLYIGTATWLYKELLAPILQTTEDIEHLILVPDGVLGHIPFEAFLIEKPEAQLNYSDFHYLLNDFKISYNYSATLWKENREQPQKKSKKPMLAFAASYGEQNASSTTRTARAPHLRNLREALNDLPAAKQEVEALSKLFIGDFLYGNGANEAAFKAKASDYGIIHLAMHGLLNRQHPILSSLAFTEDGDSLEDNFLQAYEISHLQLNAQLVVLSACETGYGKFQQGEGVMSLARSFMYAGTPSLVVSMWQVNDASTSIIMQYIYKNLAKGMDKAAALQQAKLTYVKTIHESSHEPMAAHPAFWAPFVQLGDSRRLSQK